jgi:hypothetical protein
MCTLRCSVSKLIPDVISTGDKLIAGIVDAGEQLIVRVSNPAQKTQSCEYLSEFS